MATTQADWQAEFEAWFAPFLARLRRAEQRRWAPVYLQGLLGPGERKSVEPMAARVAPGDVQQLHHFISTSPWRCEPLEEELVRSRAGLDAGALCRADYGHAAFRTRLRFRPPLMGRNRARAAERCPLCASR